jgi:O-6-methylguanine DNA methyltransferase
MRTEFLSGISGAEDLSSGTVRTEWITVVVHFASQGVRAVGLTGAGGSQPGVAVRQLPRRPLTGWQRKVLDLLQKYLAGAVVDLSGIPIVTDSISPFARRVLGECRRIPYGETATYGELASRVGRPRAARAVGGALRHNPVPLIVPCHRVLRSDGGLGGFSAPGGIDVKRRLLALEAKGITAWKEGRSGVVNAS